MSPIAAWGLKPNGVDDDAAFAAWFAQLLSRLLNRTDFLVRGETYRFAELEIYYWGDGHRDPFAHRDPVQAHNGRWYFHRTGGQYRAGSFKGLDLTFGDGDARVGVLIRTLVAPDGTVIDGPSLTVDHLLARTGEVDPASLDRRLGSRHIWDESAPLAVRESAAPRAQPVYATPRVGLSLRRALGRPEMPRFLMRPYRFLTEPRSVAKGRPHLVLALYRQGMGFAEIAAVTGVARRVVEKYAADFEAGKAVPDFGGYVGRELNTGELCRLMGTWAAHYG